DLALDAVVAGDALGAEHLLDLEAQRVAVLEGEGQLVADLGAPRPLVGDDPPSEIFSDRRIERRPEDVAALELGELGDHFYPRESRPFWNRPAWDFSARASVSNHSAISSKPSSRAERAKPGYISVYS